MQPPPVGIPPARPPGWEPGQIPRGDDQGPLGTVLVPGLTFRVTGTRFTENAITVNLTCEERDLYLHCFVARA